jgi:type IV pilus assembly protein PilV
MLMQAKNRGSAEGGFLLIEALISILIFSVGLIGLIGLQAMAINNTLHGKYRTEASYLANSIVGQMMVDQSNVAGYADSSTPSANRAAWDAEVLAALPNAATSVTIVGGTAVTVVVSWRNADETVSQLHNYTALAQVVF